MGCIHFNFVISNVVICYDSVTPCVFISLAFVIRRQLQCELIPSALCTDLTLALILLRFTQSNSSLNYCISTRIAPTCCSTIKHQELWIEGISNSSTKTMEFLICLAELSCSSISLSSVERLVKTYLFSKYFSYYSPIWCT